MPFDSKSLNKLQGSSTNESSSGLSNKEVAEIVKNAIRYGTWLYHQAIRQKESFNFAKGLWKKNHPDEPMPSKEELRESLESLTDESSGKSYHELIGLSLRDDWANTDAVHFSMAMLEEAAEGKTAPEFVNVINATVSELGKDYQKAMMLHQVAHQYADDPKTLN